MSLTLPTRLLLRSLLACAALGASAASPAAVTYHYEAPITGWANNYVGWFTNYAALDGSPLSLDFTLASPLAANLGSGPSPVAIDPADILSWSYHGGSPFLHLESGTPGDTFSISVATDSGGQIWHSLFSVGGPVTIPNLPTPDYVGNSTFHSTLTNYHGGGYDQETLSSDYLRYYGYFKGPLLAGLSEGITTPVNGGTWSMATVSGLPSVSAVPEPQTGALMLAGLGALGLLGRRGATRSATPFTSGARPS